MNEQAHAEWEAENDVHCRNAFGIGAAEFARRWRASEYGPIAGLDGSGNWQDELILRLGRSLDAADGCQS